jgi:dipeptidyl aminopeptidase/acylaminoacyl peptidase
MIAPMIAATDPTIKAIALLAGQAYTGRRVMMFQNREAIDQAPLSPAQRDSIWATVPSRLDTLATTNKWIGFFMTHDPIATAKRVKQPVLILQGETDHQVSPEQADTLVAAFKAGGNRAVTMKRFPATNHLFLNDPSGLFSGYGALKDTRVRREVLGTLADWLAGVMK